MVAGMSLASLSFIVAALVQIYIDVSGVCVCVCVCVWCVCVCVCVGVWCG